MSGREGIIQLSTATWQTSTIDRVRVDTGNEVARHRNLKAHDQCTVAAKTRAEIIVGSSETIRVKISQSHGSDLTHDRPTTYYTLLVAILNCA